MFLIQLVVIQVVTFIALVLVLVKIMHSASFTEIKRMRRLSEQNAQKLQELNDKMIEAEKMYKDRIDAAEKDANRIRSEAKEEAGKQNEELLSKARSDAERMVQQALNSKEKIKEELELGLRQRALEQSFVLIRNVLNSRHMLLLHQLFIQDVITDMRDIDVSRFKVAVDHGVLIMAHDVEPALREEIAEVLSVKIGRTILLESSIDDSLIAGIVVKLGNIVIDGSLQGRLKESCEALKT